jgi:hypothetical protein
MRTKPYDCLTKNTITEETELLHMLYYFLGHVVGSVLSGGDVLDHGGSTRPSTKHASTRMSPTTTVHHRTAVL